MIKIQEKWWKNCITSFKGYKKKNAHSKIIIDLILKENCDTKLLYDEMFEIYHFRGQKNFYINTRSMM